VRSSPKADLHTLACQACAASFPLRHTSKRFGTSEGRSPSCMQGQPHQQCFFSTHRMVPRCPQVSPGVCRGTAWRARRCHARLRWRAWAQSCWAPCCRVTCLWANNSSWCGCWCLASTSSGVDPHGAWLRPPVCMSVCEHARGLQPCVLLAQLNSKRTLQAHPRFQGRAALGVAWPLARTCCVAS